MKVFNNVDTEDLGLNVAGLYIMMYTYFGTKKHDEVGADTSFKLTINKTRCELISLTQNVRCEFRYRNCNSS